MLQDFFNINSHKKLDSIKAYFGSALLGILMFGCSTTSQVPQVISQKVTPQWLEHKAKLEKLENFDIRGRMAFHSDEQKISANFLWVQQGDNLSLRLTHFLGSTLLKIDSTPRATVIVDHRGNRYQGKDMSSLVESLTGVDLPIEQLVDWIKALPTKVNSYQLNERHLAAKISEYSPPKEYLGWQMTYSSYANFNQILLPTKILMQNQDQKVNLVISNWKTSN